MFSNPIDAALGAAIAYSIAVAALAIAGVVFTVLAYTLSPTNRYMNVSSVGFTPTGGSNTALTGVTSAAYDEQISTKKEGADFDQFPTVSVCDYRDPTITIETLDAQAGALSSGIVAGVKGALLLTVRDAYNGAAAGGGAKLYTMSNAQLQGRNMNQAYREYGKQTLVFGAISSDGATHPVAVTAV